MAYLPLEIPSKFLKQWNIDFRKSGQNKTFVFVG